MAIVKFNKRYDDYKLGRIVEANEEVEMDKERADELVNTVRGQSSKKEFRNWKDFDYEIVEEDAVDYDKLNKEELYPLLDEKNVEYTKKEAKDDLIKKLEDATAEQEEDVEE